MQKSSSIKREGIFHADGFPLAVRRMNPQTSAGLHSHQFSELVIIVRGSGIHTTGGQDYAIKTGDGFVIHGSREHGYRDTQDLHLINVLYQRELLAGQAVHLREVPGYHVLFTLEPAYHKRHGFANRLHLSLAELSRVGGWVDALEKELRDRSPGYRFTSIALFMQIVGFLSRAYGRAPASAAGELMRIARAISHLENHYPRPIGLGELAGIAHMSKRSLTRVFEKVMGHSPIDYLIRLRVARAAELLRSGEKKILAVASEVGFQDSNYFARQFRQVLGVSPSHFRKRENPAG